MSGVAIESSPFVASAVRRLRSGAGILRAASLKLAAKVTARPLLACALLLLGSISAASAVILFKPAPDVPPAILTEDPANAAISNVRAKCPECGVVEAMRELAPLAVDARPAVAGDGGRGPRSQRTYEITLRMKDGGSHHFVDTNPANWRLGERVLLIGGPTRSSE
jgi:hypothetical protein